ncbi:MAG TPA: carbohydrate ABC transporter permease [Ignavibacteria bacterium]|nr:carbohydrate ABC transporter permease [Ignavibacteria bacterium]
MSEKKLKKLLIYSGAFFMFFFCITPFVWMIIVSLSEHPDFLSSNVKFIFTLNNFVQVLTSRSVHLLAYLKNSIVISSVTAIITTFLAGLSAYAITRLKFPGKIIIPMALLGFSMFPQISIVGYLFKLLTMFGWINTYPALIFPYITLGLPLALWIMLSHFSQISTDFDNAALVDGATRFQILLKVIFPIALPGAFSTFILVFIYSFNEFLFALMFTIDYHARTIPVGIALFEGLHGQIPWGYIMAAAVVATLPVIILIALFQRFIIKGITEGSIKG